MNRGSHTFPGSRPGILRRVIALFLALTLSGVTNAVGVALAAEVVATEVVAGVPDRFVEVEQGTSASFTIELKATGVLHKTIKESEPSRARVVNGFSVSGSVVAPASVSEWKAFWADSNAKATWDGAPDPYVIVATVTAAPDAVPGEYSIRIPIEVTNPAGVTGQVLEDATADTITIRVLPRDVTPPVTSIAVEGAEGENGWLVSEATVTLVAVDPPGGTTPSGVARTEYSLDNGMSWTTYTGPFRYSERGVRTIHYRSVDAKGNTEVAKAATIKIDLDDPVISIAGVVDGEWRYEAWPAVSVGDPDPGSGVSASSVNLNGAPYAGTPITIEGSYELVVLARDGAGRTAARSVSFTIDRTSPVVTIEHPAPGAYREAQLFAYRVEDADPVVSISAPFESGTTIAGEGRYDLTVVATDRAGNSGSGSVSFLIDRTPPVTNVEAAGAIGANGWFVSPVTVYLTAEDPVSGGAASGVKATYYRVGDGPFVEYDPAAPPVLAASGVYALTFYSVDAAGNVEAVKSAVLSVDVDEPTASLSFEGTRDPGSAWFRSPVLAVPSGSDDTSGIDRFEVNLDEGGWTALAPSGVLVAEGRHTIAVRAVDLAGNTGPARAYEVLVDMTPPVSAIALDGARGANGWFVSPVDVTLNATDGEGSGVRAIRYSLDGVAWEPYDGPFALAAGGYQTVWFQAVDEAGNEESVRIETVRIDTSPPVVIVGGVEDGAWVHDATVSFDAFDAESGVESVSATLNGEPFTSGSTVDVEGDYELVVVATNGAGLETTVRRSFTVDRTAPDITIENPADGGAYNSPQELRFTVADRDPEVVVGSTYPQGFVFADEGAYVVSVDATDRARNHASRSIAFMIDLTAPVTSIALDGVAGDNGWWRSPVLCALNASDPVSHGVASGVARTLFAVDGSEEGEYEAPFSLAREGRNAVAFRSVDRAGNAEEAVLADVYIDTGAPEGWLEFTGTMGNGGWYVSDVSAIARGTDPVSGISRFEISVDGGPWLPYENPVTIGEGVHAVAVRAFDVAGNVSEPASYEVRVDRSAPETACAASGTPGANGWFVSDVTLELAATDNPGGSGVAATEYSLDGGATWQPYEAPVVVDEEGVTTVQYRSIDAAGNIEPAKSCVVRIDRRAPVISIAGVNDGDWVFEAAPQFDADDPDPGAGVEQVVATLNGAPFASGGSVALEGDYELVVTARDVAGNVASALVRFTVDRTAPVITIIEPLDGGEYNRDVTFDFAVDDRDPELVWTSDPAKGFTFSGEGAYEARVEARDRAGNASDATARFIIDLTPPETAVALHGAAGDDGWWRSSVTAYLNASDPVSGGVASGVKATFYRLNGGAFVPYDPTGVVVADEGLNVLEFYSEDEAGNREPTRTVEIRVDTEGPVVAIGAPAGERHEYGEEITIDISAADGVSGVRETRAWFNGAEVADGERVTLTQPGLNTFVVESRDVAGNVTRVTHTFVVAFVPGAWLPPVSLTPPASVGEAWNAGRALPIKFTVLDAAGRRTADAIATVEVRKGGAVVAQGVAVVQYDSAGLPFYMFHWKTVKGAVGVYDIRVTLNDGVTVMARSVALR